MIMKKEKRCEYERQEMKDVMNGRTILFDTRLELLEKVLIIDLHVYRSRLPESVAHSW